MASKSTAVAVAEEPKSYGAPALPDFLAGTIEADAGLGLSQHADDNIVPLLYVLQDNSPQVKERDPEYIPGARPGDLWIKGSDFTIKPEEGLVVQPCAFRKDWVEWVPRNKGGGYVGRHDDKPADAREVSDPENPNRKRFVLPNGNEINETRYHYLIARGMAITLPLSSTGHTVSRDWMAKMNSMKVGGKPAPAFAQLWKLSTKLKTNQAGEWFAITTEPVGWVGSMDDYNAGKELHRQVEAGIVTAAAEDDAQRDSAASGAGGQGGRPDEAHADVPF